MNNSFELEEFDDTIQRPNVSLKVERVMILLANNKRIKKSELKMALGTPNIRRRERLISVKRHWPELQSMIKSNTNDKDYEDIKDELRGLSLTWFLRVISDSRPNSPERN